MDLSICIPCLNRSRMGLPLVVDSIVRAAIEVGCLAEIVVADYGSTDWPPAEWLPERAIPLSGRVLHRDGRFSVGDGKNAAAEAALADCLLFWETDLVCPPSLIRRGMAVTAKGKAYFPRYRREKRPGGELYWGAGHGCCMVRREHWLENHWIVGYDWSADEDTVFARWFYARGLAVREDEPAMIHLWHPLSESKKLAEAVHG